MKKFIVETYYTCTFKTLHTLDELNDVELSKIDSRKDGEVEVIDVKLNNRKTKKIGNESELGDKKNKASDDVLKNIPEQIYTALIVDISNKIPLKNKRNNSQINFETQTLIISLYIPCLNIELVI